MPTSLSFEQLLGILVALAGIAGTVQALGNRSMNRSIEANVGSRLARIEEKQDSNTKSFDEHKRLTENAARQMSLAVEAIRSDNSAIRERVSVVEDRTAQIIGSGPWSQFKNQNRGQG